MQILFLKTAIPEPNKTTSPANKINIPVTADCSRYLTFLLNNSTFRCHFAAVLSVSVYNKRKETGISEV